GYVPVGVVENVGLTARRVSAADLRRLRANEFVVAVVNEVIFTRIQSGGVAGDRRGRRPMQDISDGVVFVVRGQTTEAIVDDRGVQISSLGPGIVIREYVRAIVA